MEANEVENSRKLTDEELKTILKEAKPVEIKA